MGDVHKFHLGPVNVIYAARFQSSVYLPNFFKLCLSIVPMDLIFGTLKFTSSDNGSRFNLLSVAFDLLITYKVISEGNTEICYSMLLIFLIGLNYLFLFY